MVCPSLCVAMAAICSCSCLGIGPGEPIAGAGARARARFGGIAVSNEVFRLQARRMKRSRALIARCESGSAEDKPAFGYTRKDVLLIGLGITVFGFGLKTGLEKIIGLDSLKAGNVVQLVMVLGLTVGWILSYVLRVSNKDMTYTKQLKDYELKVMEKRFQELPEAEMETLLAQVEEEKKSSRSSSSSSNNNNTTDTTS